MSIIIKNNKKYDRNWNFNRVNHNPFEKDYFGCMFIFWI